MKLLKKYMKIVIFIFLHVKIYFAKYIIYFLITMIKFVKKNMEGKYMSTLQEMRYKETSPDKTVKRIKEILKNSGVEVEENWAKKSCVGTYSLRLCVKGTNIGQNGKGMTKEFAMASAYAEFLERYQNGVLVFRQEKPNKELPFVYSADEKNLTIQELVDQNDSFINQVFII